MEKQKEKTDPNIPEIVDIQDDPTIEKKGEEKPVFDFRPEDYINILNQIRVTKRHITVAPTITPKNFMEQIQLFDDGVDYRLYLFVNGTWRYVALT